MSSTPSKSDDLLISKVLKSFKVLVEMLGVEPRSESNPSPESTCVVCVLDWILNVHKQTLLILRRL